MSNTTIYSHYVYRITNLVENKHYYGKRSTSVSPELDLGKQYFSSSTDAEFIQDQQVNPQNYRYKIIRRFDTAAKAVAFEVKLHNKFNVGINESFYNKAKQSSSGFDTTGTVTVRDPVTGEIIQVDKNDPRYLSGELVHISVGQVTVRNPITGETMSVDKTDPRYLSGELIHITVGKVNLKDPVTGEIIQVDKNDPRYLSGELVGTSSGTVTVRNPITEETMSVDKTDPRYLNGELVPIWKGRTHTDSTKKKMSERAKIHQAGSGNSQFGTCWIFHSLIGSKKIPEDKLPLYIEQGWEKGRKMNWFV